MRLVSCVDVIFDHPAQCSAAGLEVFCWLCVEMIYRGLIIRIHFEIAILASRLLYPSGWHKCKVEYTRLKLISIDP